MEQQSIGNNSLTFVINNFIEKPRRSFCKSQDHNCKYNFHSNPGFSKNHWSAEDMQNREKQNYLLGTGSFTDQRQKQNKLFKNNKANARHRRRKRKKKVNVNYKDTEGIQQNLIESSKVNPKKHINSKKELSTFFGNPKYYEKSVKSFPLATSTSPKTYHIHSNNFINKISNNYNISNKCKKKRKTNTHSGNNCSGRSISASSDSNVDKKKDTDLFYFDISGNNVDETVSLPERKHINNRLNFLKEFNNCNDKVLPKETSALDVPKLKASKEQHNLEESVVDISNEDNYLGINDSTLFKNVERKCRKISKEHVKNVEQNSSHTGIFNCDTFDNMKDKFTLEKIRGRRKKKNRYMERNESNNLNFLYDNKNKDLEGIYDKKDISIDTGEQHLKSEEVDTIIIEDKDEPNIYYKKKNKQETKNKEILSDVSDCNSRAGSGLSKKTLHESYDCCMKNSNEPNVLLKYDKSQNTENEKHNFILPYEVKKKKSKKKSCESAVTVSDSECEIIDFVNSNPKKKDKHFTYTVEERNDSRKKKQRDKAKMRNNFQENSAWNPNATKIVLHNNLPIISRNISREYDEVNVTDELTFLKTKRKKHKSCQADNIISCTKTKNTFKNSNEDRHCSDKDLATAGSSRDNILENNNFNRNMLNLQNYNADLLKNKSRDKSNLLTITRETKTCSILNSEDLETNNTNEKSDEECEIIDFICSNKKKKRQNCINNVLDTNNTPKNKQKLEIKKNDMNTSKTDRNKLLIKSPNNNRYEIYKNLQAKANRRTEKSKVKDTDTSTIISEDECEIIDYVNSNPKKKRKHITSAESNICSTPTKKRKTTMKICDDNINLNNFSLRRNSYSDLRESNGFLQTGDIALDYTEKQEKLKKDDKQQKNYCKPNTVKSLNMKHCQDPGLVNQNSFSQESNLNDNDIPYETKNNSHKSHKASDDDHSSDSSEIIISERKTSKRNTKTCEKDTSNLTNEAKISKSYTNKSSTRAVTNGADSSSAKVKVKENRKDHMNNLYNESMTSEENSNKYDDIECEIIDYVGSNTKKKEKHATSIGLDGHNTPKKKYKKAKVKNEDDINIANALNNFSFSKVNNDENELHGESFVEEYKTKKKKNKHLNNQETGLDCTKDEEILLNEELNSEQQMNYNELDTIKSVKENGELQNCNNIPLNHSNSSSKHEMVNETKDSTYDSEKTFSDDQSSDESDIISSKWKLVQHNTEIYEDGTSNPDSDASTSSEYHTSGSNIEHNSEIYEDNKSNSVNDALTSSEYHSNESDIEHSAERYEDGTSNPSKNASSEYHNNESNIGATTETDLKSTAKRTDQSGHIENEENDDKKTKPNIRRTSVFAEYMQSKEDTPKSEEKPIIPEICTDPEDVEDDIEKLKDLTVLLPFTIPPLHALVTRTTKPTKEQLEKIKQTNLPVKLGPFSKAEDEKIIENWKELCKNHDLRLNPSPFIKFPRKMKMETKLNILRYIGHGLDDRLLPRIYIRFRDLLQKDHVKTGRFTPEEDKILLEFLGSTDSAQPFSDLSKLLNRKSTSVERRYDTLTNNNKVVYWTLGMVDRFVRALMKITKCEKIKKLRHREFTSKEWEKLSKKLDNIPVKKLQRAWKVTIYPRLFSKEVDMREMKEDLIHILCDRNETDWRRVDWKEIAKNFKGFTAAKIYMMFKHLSNFHVPKEKRSDLKECLDFLKNKVLKYDRIPTTHKFKKFIVKNGHLTYNSEDSS